MRRMGTVGRRYGRLQRAGTRRVVKLLLATGRVDVDAKDENDRTPLGWAAAGGHEAVVKLLQSIFRR
jgi:ankyrin repeat protein